MVNSPLPKDMPGEIKRAVAILRDFTIPSAERGPDSVIPSGILARAKGLCIMSIFKIGFLITARGGSGIVIARLPGGGPWALRSRAPCAAPAWAPAPASHATAPAEWSAPSAIGVAGIGGGLELGAEVTDFILILNSHSAVEAFSKGTNVTLGGNLTVAAGPYGRNMEGSIAVRSVASVYTYSKSKGIFAGISLEGSCLIERKDDNRKFYGDDTIRASDILSGSTRRADAGCVALRHAHLRLHLAADVPAPPEAQILYDTLAEQIAARRGAGDDANASTDTGGGGNSGGSDRSGSRSMSTRSNAVQPPPPSRPSKPSLFSAAPAPARAQATPTKTPNTQWNSTRRVADPVREVNSAWQSSNDAVPVAVQRSTWNAPRPAAAAAASSRPAQAPVLAWRPTAPSASASAAEPVSASQWNGAAAMAPSSAALAWRPTGDGGAAAAAAAAADPASAEPAALRARALYDFAAQQPSDLGFVAGDMITVTRHTDSTNDWWDGELNGAHGSFPANYVEFL